MLNKIYPINIIRYTFTSKRHVIINCCTISPIYFIIILRFIYVCAVASIFSISNFQYLHLPTVKAHYIILYMRITGRYLYVIVYNI